MNAETDITPMSDDEFKELLDKLIREGKIQVISPIGYTSSGAAIFPKEVADGWEC